jgi:hypothetical protein
MTLTSHHQKKSETISQTKRTGVALLAQKMGRGMVAITEALQQRQSNDGSNELREQQRALVALTAQLLEAQQAQTEMLASIVKSTTTSKKQ